VTDPKKPRRAMPEGLTGITNDGVALRVREVRRESESDNAQRARGEGEGRGELYTTVSVSASRTRPLPPLLLSFKT
jgi:hypothetical protein